MPPKTPHITVQPPTPAKDPSAAEPRAHVVAATDRDKLSAPPLQYGFRKSVKRVLDGISGRRSRHEDRRLKELLPENWSEWADYVESIEQENKDLRELQLRLQETFEREVQKETANASKKIASELYEVKKKLDKATDENIFAVWDNYGLTIKIKRLKLAKDTLSREFALLEKGYKEQESLLEEYYVEGEGCLRENADLKSANAQLKRDLVDLRHELQLAKTKVQDEEHRRFLQVQDVSVELEETQVHRDALYDEVKELRKLKDSLEESVRVSELRLEDMEERLEASELENGKLNAEID
ncbi:hypothetical protein FRC03_000983, partial [Tulasnella sp. 419]